MSKKKSTGGSPKRKPRRSGGSHTRREKAPSRGAPETAAPQAEQPVGASGTPTKRRRSRGGRGRKSGSHRPAERAHVETASAAETTLADTGAVAADAAARALIEETDTAENAPVSGVRPITPAARVEQQDGNIVIRFPPAAPPPFLRLPKPEPARAPAPPATPRPAMPEPEPEEPEEEPPPRSRVDAEVTRPETRIRERDWDQEPEAPPASEEHPVASEVGSDQPLSAEDERHLSPSQKRRLRRRRAREKRNGAEPTVHRPPPAPTEFIAPDELRSKPAPPEEDSQDPTPWLAAAESIRSGLSQPEAEVPNGDAEAAAEPEAPAAEAPPPLRPREEEPPPRERGRRRRRRGRRSARHDAVDEAPQVERAPVAVAEPEATADKKAKPTALREMVINASAREECRIAILENGRLEEIYLERAAAENHVGNIYKGVVTNVEASIQAAFIDFGQGKNGFLHISDLHPQYFPDGAGHTENVGHKTPRRSRPPIQRCLRRNQELIVQVTKEGIGTKGPTLSTYLSIPGRFLVMMPGMGRLGVSRRIEDDDSREKLRRILAELELPDGMGFIARTAALDRTKRELQSDLTYLTRLWRAVANRVKTEPAPAELYRESDLVIRTIRDVFTSDIERIVVDDAEVAERARDFLSVFSPRSDDIVMPYTNPEPMFHKYGIEAELERLHSRRVPLKSGGSLVIDQTEALVAIDVNSGRFRTEADAEMTAYKINLEAADEIARQLRLRDMGGVVVCDFIDMRGEAHRREIERRLAKNLKEHKERAKVLRMSEFGIIELTRQRQRASLTRSVYQDCRHCRGSGLVKTVESVALDVMRLLQLAVTREHIHTIEVAVSPEVSFLLQNRKRQLLHELEAKTRRSISIRPDPGYSLDQVEIRCTDPRGRLVPHT